MSLLGQAGRIGSPIIISFGEIASASLLVVLQEFAATDVAGVPTREWQIAQYFHTPQYSVVQ